MDRSSQLMFALQSPVGLRFGATQSVEADRITFEMDIQLTKGTECPYRMELTGVEDTVMGVVRIDRVLPKRHGALPSFIAKIVSMPEVDRNLFDGWRRDQATGGISRRMERDPEAIKEQISDQMRGSTVAEARVVLDKMASKSIYMRKSADRIEGDPFGLEDESAEVPRADGGDLRSRLRASAKNLSSSASPLEDAQVATSAASAASVAAASDPPDLPDPPAPSGAANAGDPEWLRPIQAVDQVESDQSMVWLDNDDPSLAQTAPAPEPEPEPEPDLPSAAEAAPVKPSGGAEDEPVPEKPLIVVDSSQNPVAITVAYLSQSALAAGLDAGLSASAMTVQHSALEILYLPVQIQFSLPSGKTLTCQGQTVARTSRGTALALALDPTQHKALEDELS